MGFLDDIKKFLNPKDEPAKDNAAEQKNEQQEKNPEPPVQQAVPEQVAQPEPQEESGVGETEKVTAEQKETTTENPVETTKPEEQNSDKVSAPQIRAAVIKNISALLKPLLGKDDFKGIALYATQSIYAIALDKEFENMLRIEFDNRGFKSLGNGKVEIYESKPTAEAHDVYDNIIFAEILTKESISHYSPRKARISIYHGKGSLKQDEYILDTAADNKKTYCIGRGDISTKGGVFRENDIVIDDAETNPAIVDLNKYVSSSHANIEVLDGGFYLKAMPGGIANGNATKYIRDGKVFKLETDSMSYPLQDGDIIELGRTVLLKFEVIE